MICIDKENETGIKILVDNNSFEVTVCDSSGKYSNGYEAVVVSKSLLAMIDGKFRSMSVTGDTLEWLESHKKTVDSIALERIEHNNPVKYPLPSTYITD